MEKVTVVAQYIGRKKFLQQLTNLEQKPKASIVVIKGRRRVGKSRLVEEFAKNKIYIPFTGMAPVAHLTSQDQINNFAQQLCVNFKLANHTFANWADAFNSLGIQLQLLKTSKSIVVLFDEISWMAHNSHDFLSQLKAWWDLQHSKIPQLILLLCGSVSVWIEENILNSTGFFGRISLQITLPPLTLVECADFLRMNNIRGSAYDYYKILSIMGGIPWYLEQVLPSSIT